MLLPLLLWAQVLCAVPQLHDHIETGQAPQHAEMGDHVAVVPDSQHSGEDGSQHELHLHTCGFHVVGLPSTLPLISLRPSLFIDVGDVLNAPVAVHERLLRPPIA